MGVVGVREEVGERRLGDESRSCDVEDAFAVGRGRRPHHALHRPILAGRGLTWPAATSACSTAGVPIAIAGLGRSHPVAAAANAHGTVTAAMAAAGSSEDALSRTAVPTPRTSTVAATDGRDDDTAGRVPRFDLVARHQQPQRRRQDGSGGRRDQQQRHDLAIEHVADAGLRPQPEPHCSRSPPSRVNAAPADNAGATAVARGTRAVMARPATPMSATIATADSSMDASPVQPRIVPRPA